MERLHARLRWLRKRHDLTLAQVADRTGLTIGFLSDIERGRSLPGLDTLERIADVYGLSIGELLVNVRIRGEEE